MDSCFAPVGARNVFHVVSALQSFVFIHIIFWLIRSLVDPTLTVFIVCGPLQLVTHLGNLKLNFIAKSIGIHSFWFEYIFRCYRDTKIFWPIAL